MRAFLHIALPLLLPALVYLLWVVVTSNRRLPGWWSEVPWAWLAASGAALAAVSLTWWALMTGHPPGVIYHPPSYEDGQVVPSYIE